MKSVLQFLRRRPRRCKHLWAKAVYVGQIISHFECPDCGAKL